MSEVRTSLNSPLRIHGVSAGSSGGAIGLTLCPGKHCHSSNGSRWERDLTMDLAAIRDWGAKSLVTVMEDDELRHLDVVDLGAAATRLGFWWFRFPIARRSVPNQRFDRAWLGSGQSLLTLLNDGARIVIHCRGGIKRTGLVASCLLIELGDDPVSAIQKVRSIEPGAIGTSKQELYVRGYQRRLRLLSHVEARSHPSLHW